MAEASERTAEGKVRTQSVTPSHELLLLSLPALTTGIRDGGGYTDTSLKLFSAFLTSAGKASRGCGYIEEHPLRVGCWVEMKRVRYSWHKLHCKRQ